MNTQEWYRLEWLSLETLSSFEWQEKTALYVLAAIPVVFLLRWLFQSRDKEMVVLSLEPTVIKKANNWLQMLRFMPMLMQALAIAMALLAFARPQRESETVKDSQQGIEIVLAVDFSESMNATDLQPTRMQVAKNMAKAFIEGRPNDRIGLVGFAGQAVVLCPLTTDHGMLVEVLSENHTGLFSESGTALGDALGKAVNNLRALNTASKVVILISDGAETAGLVNAEMVAELSKKFNIKIYAIAVGSDLQKSTDQAEVVDVSSLKQIALNSNGKFYRATSQQTLENIFKQINTLERTQANAPSNRTMDDFYPIYLSWALCFFILSILIKCTFMGNILED